MRDLPNRTISRSHLRAIQPKYRATIRSKKQNHRIFRRRSAEIGDRLSPLRGHYTKRVESRCDAVAMDNNVSEREMKRVVLHRKNSLFVGNPRGGRTRTGAILASLTSTCRRHDIDPQLYLTQLLTNLSQVRKSELPNWLPDLWKQLQAERLRS